MSEFRDIENQLRSLSPKDPPIHLTKRIEQGLGEAGNLAVRRFPDENKPPAREKKSATFFPIVLDSVWQRVYFCSHRLSNCLMGSSPLTRLRMYQTILILLFL